MHHNNTEFISGGKKGRPPSTPVPHDNAKLLQFNTQLDNLALVLFGQSNKLQSEQAAFYLHDAWATGGLDLQDAEQHLAPNGVGFAVMPGADQFANAVVALEASKELAYWNFFRVHWYVTHQIAAQPYPYQRKTPRKRADRPDKPSSSGVFVVVFCHKDFQGNVPYHPENFVEVSDTGGHFFTNDLKFPKVGSKVRKLIPKELKSGRMMMPLQLYSFLLNTFMPANTANNSEKPLFVYDPRPSLCFGLVPALEKGLMYTIPATSAMPTAFADFVRSLVLEHFDDLNLESILAEFKELLPKIVLKQGTLTPRHKRRSALYSK